MNNNIFDNDEFILKKTINIFNKNQNKEEYGKQPGSFDLSVFRFFNRPKSIYDFITDDDSFSNILSQNFPIINEEFDITIPSSSLATDIFIDDIDCIIDINPQNLEYSTIPNTVGTNDRGILIGDYKVSKPKDQKIQKDGVMETPLLEEDSQKQAF